MSLPLASFSRSSRSVSCRRKHCRVTRAERHATIGYLPTYPKEKSDADTILGRPAPVRSTAEGASVKDPASRPRVWPDAVRLRNPALTSHMLDRVATTTALGALAEWLGLDIAAGLKASPTAWAATLLRVEDDIRGEPRQRLLAYLLGLALARPGAGCEPLFERAFESIHADIWASRLPYAAFGALVRFLPDLYWWQQWDACLRLRLAVVAAYVNAELDPRSFRRLTSDRTLFDRLVKIASDTKLGRRFLRRVFD
jgi:hypothetical protein